MTAEWHVAASASLLLAAFGLLLSLPALLWAALPFAAVALCVWLVPFPDTSVDLSASVEPRAVIDGETARLTLTVTNIGEALDRLSVAALLPAGLECTEAAQVHSSLERGRSLTLEIPVKGPRGCYDVGSVAVAVQDLLGLRERASVLHAPATLEVRPPIERLRRVGISPIRTRAYAGTVRSRIAGSGLEFFGTREYAPGDSPRHINWRVAGRWDRLVTNLYEEDRVADVGIILDARRASDVTNARGSLFEHSARAAASLCSALLKEGNRVGLLVYGGGLDWVYPGYGQRQQARIGAMLSRTRPVEHVVFADFRHLPIRLFPPQSQLLFVSPLLPEDGHPLRYLRALGYRVLVVSPNPVSFEAEDMPRDREAVLARQILCLRRATLLASLRRSGVRVVDWEVSLPLASLLEPSRRVRA